MELLAELKPDVLIATVIYTLIGLGMCGGSLFLATWIAPFSIRKEVEEDQNAAVGIILGSIFIGISIIVAAAIH